MNGWIKLWRAMQVHPVWNLPPAQFKVWVTILMLANHQERDAIVKGERVTIPAGSLVRSQRHLAEDAGVGRQVVRDAIKSLRNLGTITTHKRTQRKLLIEVVNWPSYQGDDAEKNPKENPAKNPIATQSQPYREKGRREEPFAGDPAPAEGNGQGRNTRAKKPTDPNVKALIDYWHQTYRARFGSPPPVNGGEDGSNAKRLLAGRDLEEAKWLVREHIHNPPNFFEQNRLYRLGHVLKAATVLLARKAEQREFRS